MPDPAYAKRTLKELIRRGRDPTGKEALDFALSELVGSGAKVRRVSPTAAVASFGEPRLVLSGHVDVVPPGEGWRVDPFGGVERAGAVHGRGAADMKGSVACMLALARNAAAGDFAVTLTTDEETTMQGGAALARSGLFGKTRLFVVGEPTDLAVAVAQRGLAWVELSTGGTMAHGSMPGLGENAIRAMARLLSSLDRFRLGRPHRLTGGATVSVGTISGGTRPNVVPDRCTATVDLRYPPSLSPREALRGLHAALRRSGVPYRWRVVNEHPGFARPANDRHVRLARAAAKAATGRDRVFGVPYGTEAAEFGRLRRPMVVLGPGDPRVIHTNRERILVDDLRKGLAAYEHIGRALGAI
ncbi:MAG: M20 family metallopeptidase [Methanobacteriota archaeon]